MELFIGSKYSEQQFLLQEQELHHCIRVTRHKVGDNILVTDFNGTIYNGVLFEFNSNHAIVQIQSIYKTETKGPQLSIAISPTHQMDRFEWFVEKAVECGVHTIVPLLCKRTENSKVKLERTQRIITNAAKQTLRPLLPEILEIQTFSEFISDVSGNIQKFIAHCENEPKSFLGKLYHPKDDALILIGPAGDFTQAEIELAKQNDFIAVTLGDYRLRTETAGICALQILQTIKQL